MVVPVLDNLSTFETPNVETHPRDGEVVFGMRKHEIAILKDTYGVDLDRPFWTGLPESGYSG
jgi:hypothetical protein